MRSFHNQDGKLEGTALSTLTDDYTYNSFGEVTGYVAKNGSTTLYSYTLTRDALGRISQKVETLNGVTSTFDYTYDTAGRLTQTNKNSTTVRTYSYDSNSNRTGGTINGTSTSATYDNQDRMTAYNIFDYVYDLNGDLQTKTDTLLSQTTTYTYDVFGNLTQVALPTKTISYEIDVLNRRMGRKLNGNLQSRYLHDDQGRLIAEFDTSDTLIRRYVYASKSHVPDYFIDDADEKYRIFTDHLGSVRLVVKLSTGAVMQRMEHDEFGRVATDTSPGYQPFGFAGGIYDPDTILVRFGARDYDPVAGRWTSKDPILFGGGDSNLYGYTFNDPVNLIDPSGLRIADQTGGAIPPEVKSSQIYRNLDNSRNLITIGINNNLGPNVSGVTRYNVRGTQTIDINVSAHRDYNDYVDTYIHELNHAALNIAFRGRTGEMFDTQLILPTVIRNNFGPGGISAGQCR